MSRVLVVDDYPEAAEVLCTLIQLLGHECRTARAGREALELAQAFRPEIAIVDLGLPDLSGYDVARRLREQAAGRPLYLAAVSGWAEPARARAAGFDHHIQKPIDAGVARRLLEHAIGTLNAH